MTEKKQSGILYGIGVGPGDPELITLKGYRILQETHVIAYPEAKKGAGSYARNIIDNLVDEELKELIPLTFPMTKNREQLEREWDLAVETLVKPLSEGKNTVFVSEGDPLFYSTFIYLMEKMRQRLPELVIRVIPGISSLHGAAASLGWGLTTGEQKFAVIPATENMEEMSTELDRHDTVVFYKVAKVIFPLTELLKNKNLIQYAAAVSRATSADEKIFPNLGDIPAEGIPYLSLVIVRKPEKQD